MQNSNIKSRFRSGMKLAFHTLVQTLQETEREIVKRARQWHRCWLREREREKWTKAGEEWKICCPCIKPADSPPFFRLWTATVNSAYSKLAYGNKAIWAITVITRGNFNPSPFSLLHLPHSHFLCALTPTLIKKHAAFDHPLFIGIHLLLN